MEKITTKDTLIATIPKMLKTCKECLPNIGNKHSAKKLISMMTLQMKLFKRLQSEGFKINERD